MPIGAPRVAELTESIVTLEGLCGSYDPHTDEHWYPDTKTFTPPHLAERKEQIAEVIRVIRDLVQRRHANSATASYEDIAYLLGVIADDRSGNHPNALVSRAVSDIEKETGLAIGELSSRSRQAIAEIVFHEISRTASASEAEIRSGMSWILDALEKPNQICCFASLNHDLFLERCLDSGGHTWSDGFGSDPEFGPLPVWRDAFGNNRLQILHLHGAVSWRYSTRHGVTIKLDDTTQKALGQDYSGEYVESDPKLLIGTENKSDGYQLDVFGDLQFRFSDGLSKSSALLIVGYGFRDWALNAKLINWMGMNSRTRLVVVDCLPLETVAIRARGAMTRALRQWSEIGRLDHIQSSADELDWDRVSGALATLFRDS